MRGVLMLMAIYLLILLLPTCLNADWQKQEAAIMGTVITVELWHEDDNLGKDEVEAIMGEMRRIDDLMSSYKSES